MHACVALVGYIALIELRLQCDFNATSMRCSLFISVSMSMRQCVICFVKKMSRLICQAQLSLETTTEWGDVGSGCATGGKAPKVNEAKWDFAHLLT